MRDILAGGILVTREAWGPIQPRASFSRRRRAERGRKLVRFAQASMVQPGQLASPHLRFGFPSMSMH